MVDFEGVTLLRCISARSRMFSGSKAYYSSLTQELTMRQFSMTGGCVLALTLVALLPFAAAAPLQWQQVQPVGDGPTARYSHGSCTCDAMQGALFIFGGKGALRVQSFGLMVPGLGVHRCRYFRHDGWAGGKHAA
jgi:hypothetical protein